MKICILSFAFHMEHSTWIIGEGAVKFWFENLEKDAHKLKKVLVSINLK